MSRNVPQFAEAAATNVLQAVLNAGDEIGHKFENGALVHDRARHTLCNADLVVIAKRERRGEERVSASE